MFFILLLSLIITKKGDDVDILNDFEKHHSKEFATKVVGFLVFCYEIHRKQHRVGNFYTRFLLCASH